MKRVGDVLDDFMSRDGANSVQCKELWQRT